MSKNRTTEPKEILGLNRITKKRILELCKKDKLYQTPELNDVLYLHYQGFQSIECLEEYTELKCLWLECNAISEIQGLDSQTKLKCLFLQSNLIKKIENLDYCKELDTINLSQNHIRKIENCGFEVLPALNTLNISSNYLKDCEGLKDLENCRNLSVLDLSNNRIDDILVVKIFAKLPELKVLVLQGNPVVSKIPQYRKTLILECKKLTYLDSRPVFPKDRSCAEAWKRGGYEEERKENERWNRKERRKMRDSVNVTIRMRNKNRKPEDQLTLLMSSDSEDESDARTRKRQNDLVSDVSMDNFWDEVADSTSETTSSDMTVSSSTSVNTSNDEDIRSEASRETPKTPNTDKENVCNHPLDKSTAVCNLADRENIERTSQFLSDSHNAIVTQNDAEIILKEPPKCESVLTKNSRYKFNLQTEESKISDNEIYLKNDHTDSVESSKEQYTHTINAICQATFKNLSQSESYPEAIPNRVQLQVETLNCKEDENYEPLKVLEEAMNSLIKKDDLDEENSRHMNSTISNHKNVLPDKTSTQTQYEQDCSAVNHQLKIDFEQLSVNMDNFITELNKDKEERKEAIEAFFVTEGIAKEITSGSSDNEMDDNSNELRLERVINQWDNTLKRYKHRNFAAQDEKTEIPVIWVNDKPCEEKKEDKLKVNKFEETKNLQPKEEREKDEGLILLSKNLLSQQENETILPDFKEENIYKSPDNSKLQKSETAHSFYSRQEIQQYISNIDNYLNPSNKSKEADEANDASNDQALYSGNLTQKENGKTLIEDRLNTNDADDFEYTPIDIKLLKRNSNDALNSFEKEAKELKELLQKLENENESIFEGKNTENKSQKEEKSPGNLKKGFYEQKQGEESARDKEKSIQEIKIKQTLENYRRDNEMTTQKPGERQANGSYKQIVNDKFYEKIRDKDINVHLKSTESSVIHELLEEIIQSLELKALKPKSYEFVIESDEECSYSGTKAQENLVPLETIPNCVEPFKKCLKNITSKNPVEMERPIVPYQERKLTPTTDEQKSVCLLELARQPNLKDFNCDTHNSLDEQLKQFKDKKTKKVRQIVDRVYSQRDRYNDTLEVVDGKLVILNECSGEVKELPQPTGHLSESDTDYDTAQSEEEEEAAYCSKSRQLLKADHSQDRRGDWMCNKDTNYIWSVPYKPPALEHDITSALKHNNGTDLIGQKNDINDSDESNDEFFSLDPQAKPNLYDNIDDEFFNTLTLEHLNLSEQDEHHIIQCARSYEELKKFLKLNKEERCLTEEENELLEKMAEIKSTNKQEHFLQTFPNSDKITKEENLLLKRMDMRSSHAERFENKNPESNEVRLDVKIDKIPLYKSKEAVKIFEYKYEHYDESSSSKEQRESSSEPDEKTASFEDSSTKAFVLEDPEKDNEIEDSKQYEQIELVENEEELNRQDFIENLLQRNVSFRGVKVGIEKFKTSELSSPESTSSFSGLEKYSEEEKNEIESNIDVEGTEINNILKYVPEKEYLEEKERGQTSNLDNSNTIVALKFTDFANIKETRIEGHQEFQNRVEVLVEDSVDNFKKCIQKEQFNAKDNHVLHNSNKTSQPTNYEELLSQECVVNSSIPSPDIPPNNESNFQHSTNESPTPNSTEQLSFSDYIGDFQNPAEYLQSTSTSDINVLECNLEIIGGNDEIIETITVNAEVQYDY